MKGNKRRKEKLIELCFQWLALWPASHPVKIIVRKLGHYHIYIWDISDDFNWSYFKASEKPKYKRLVQRDLSGDFVDCVCIEDISYSGLSEIPNTLLNIIAPQNHHICIRN